MRADARWRVNPEPHPRASNNAPAEPESFKVDQDSNHIADVVPNVVAVLA